MNSLPHRDDRENHRTQTLGFGLEVRTRGVLGTNTLDLPFKHAAIWGESRLNAITGTAQRTLGISANYSPAFLSYLSVPSQLQVSSISTSDVFVGSGARTVEIIGLDGAWLPITETVLLQGTTPVLTARSDWFRINTMQVLTAGSDGNNVGEIYICQVGEVYNGAFHPTTTNYCNILPTMLYSTLFSYSIPHGKTWEYVRGNFFTDWTPSKPGLLQEYYRDESSGSLLIGHTNLYLTGNVSYDFTGDEGWYGRVTIEGRIQNEVNGSNSCTAYYEYVEY